MQKVSEKGSLLDDIQQDLGRIGTSDVVVGIPTHNDRETVAKAADAVLSAARTTLSGSRGAVVHADGGSQDGTPEHLREVAGERIPLLQVRYPVYPADILAAPLAGVPGRRTAALTIFQLARQLGAKVCVLLDAAVETVTAEWVERLTIPILDGAVDHATPTYARGAFDGLINSGIATPFTRALFGKRLRQPSGAEMACAAGLVDFHLSGAARSSDPWSTVPAITNDFRVGQVSLGARIARRPAVRPELSSTLRLALGALFEEMEQTASYWQKVRGSEPAPWFGPALEIDSPPSDFNRKPMLDAFRQGCKDLVDIWNLVLPPATLLQLRRLERQPDAGFRMEDELWARLIYDFAVGYHVRAMGRDHLLEAVTPLYLGWAASFTGEMTGAPVGHVEQRLERLAMQFETQKRYLISRWRWPDKFNP